MLKQVFFDDGKNLIGERPVREHQLGGRLRLALSAVLAMSALLLTSCGGTPAALPEPDIKIYLLDLTASGDVTNQARLIRDDLISDITSRSLGSPYVNEGPTLTRFFFVGTNSRALREFSLQDHEGVYDLFQFIDDENNNTRTEKFWRLLSEKYETYLTEKIESGTTPSKKECTQEFNQALEKTWNSIGVREVYSTYMCKLATYSLTNYADMNAYIEKEGQPKEQKASDVFGALSKIDAQVMKYKSQYPTAKIKVILATDGDHNLGKNSPSNLRLKIKDNPDLCGLADEYRENFKITNLVESKNLDIDPRGISALITGFGEYPGQLEEFWNCFFPG